jgi:putative oxidoreductase
MIDFTAGVYRKLIIYGAFLAPLALLILRLGWGWELIEAGHAHLSDIPGTIENFKSFGITWHTKENVYMAATTELVGGALLMLGLASRAISIPLLFNFCVAFATASRENVAKIFQQDPKAIIDDAAYPFLITSLIIIAFGPGLFSIDAILKKTVLKRYAAGLK